MINNLQISGVHSDITEKTRAYAKKKIGGLDKYISKHARESVHTEIKLKEKPDKNNKKFQCEVIMKLPKSTLAVHKDAESVTSAIDQVEANLKVQLKKYKDTHAGPRAHRRLITRFKRSEAF